MGNSTEIFGEFVEAPNEGLGMYRCNVRKAIKTSSAWGHALSEEKRKLGCLRTAICSEINDINLSMQISFSSCQIIMFEKKKPVNKLEDVDEELEFEKFHLKFEKLSDEKKFGEIPIKQENGTFP